MIRRLASFILAAFAALVCSVAPAAAQLDPVRFDGHKVVRVQIRSEADLKTMLEISPDVWSEGVGIGDVDFRIPPEQMKELDASGIPYRVIIDDLQQRIELERQPAEGRDVSWFAGYKDLAGVSAYVDTLVALRPDLASRFTIGNSLQGRAIFGLRISSSATPNGVKPAVLFNGCQHAREWVAVTTPMYIADQLIRNYDTDPTIKKMVDGIEFFIVPIVNPDGYVYTLTNRMWRKNRRPNSGGSFGVDLNRNWDYHWGGSGASASPGDDTYRGTAAFSEPESQAVRDFIIAHSNIRAHIDFHSYSQLILAPWAYTTANAPNAASLNALASAIGQAFTNTFGVNYISGPTGQILYLAAGASTDWTYGARSIYGYGIELRDTGTFGFVLPPAQIIPTGQEAFAGMRQLTSAVLSPLTFDISAGLPTLATPDMLTPVSVKVIGGGLGEALDTTSVRVYSRVGASGAFTQSTLSLATGSTYSGQIPAAVCGSTISYFFQASTTGGQTQTSPADTTISLYSLPVGTVCAGLGDLNNDAVVDSVDLALLLGSWGPCPGSPCPADLNADGSVGAADLAMLLGAWS